MISDNLNEEECVEVTLLIAGPYNDSTLDMVKHYHGCFPNIIVSTYHDNDNTGLQGFKVWLAHNKIGNVELLETPLPMVEGLHNSQNIFLQCYTVTQGLRKVVSPRVIKIRTDEFYSSLDNVVSSLPADKVSTCNVFVRDVSYKPFHLSDHIIVGDSKVLSSAFENLKAYILKQAKIKVCSDPLGILNTNTPAETKITLFILYQFEKLCFWDWNTLSEKEVFDLMLKHFFIFDISQNEPYRVCSSVAGIITSYKRFVLRDNILFLRHISGIDDMKPRSFFHKIQDRLVFRLKKLVFARKL